MIQILYHCPVVVPWQVEAICFDGNSACAQGLGISGLLRWLLLTFRVEDGSGSLGLRGLSIGFKAVQGRMLTKCKRRILARWGLVLTKWRSPASQRKRTRQNLRPWPRHRTRRSRTPKLSIAGRGNMPLRLPSKQRLM